MYEAEINRKNQTAFVFLVDQSGSMDLPFGGTPGKKKKDGVADALNRLLQTLVFRCAKGDVIHDRYYIGVIGYGDSVGSGWGGALAGQTLVPVSQMANNPLRIETRTRKADDGAGGLVEETIRFPVWFEAVAKGRTKMCEALRLACGAVEDFVKNCPTCFPPIVINISDGAATDGDPEPEAAALRAIASQDGNVLLFNIHISSLNERPIQFPISDALLPSDDYAQRLYRMSSPLPSVLIEQAQATEIDIRDGARGFVFNGDLVSVIQFLDIGTRVQTAY